MNLRLAVRFLLTAVCVVPGCIDSSDPGASPTMPEPVDRDRPATSTKSDGDLVVNSVLVNRSSWQDPFDNVFWKNSGWEFAPSVMSAGASPARATLLRPWSRLMLEVQCDAASVDEQVSTTTDVLHLAFREATEAAQVRIRISQDSIDLQQLVDDGPWRTLKSGELDSDHSEARLRVNLTGNRVLVAWNDRLVLNSDRPSAICCPVFVVFESTDCPVSVSQMRLEGEYMSPSPSSNRPAIASEAESPLR